MNADITHNSRLGNDNLVAEREEPGLILGEDV